MNAVTLSSCNVGKVMEHLAAVLLLEGDNLWDDRTIKKELDPEFRVERGQEFINNWQVDIELQGEIGEEGLEAASDV